MLGQTQSLDPKYQLPKHIWNIGLDSGTPKNLHNYSAESQEQTKP